MVYYHVGDSVMVVIYVIIVLNLPRTVNTDSDLKWSVHDLVYVLTASLIAFYLKILQCIIHYHFVYFGYKTEFDVSNSTPDM